MNQTTFHLILAGAIAAAVSVFASVDLYGHQNGHGHEHDGGMVSRVPFEPVTAEWLERFHGHLGPFVALGARMGEHAVTEYGMPRYFGVSAQVHCPDAPPPSCLIDGLQVALGTTMGKRNLVLVPSETVKALIVNEKTGKWAEYRIKDEILAKMKDWAERETDVEERGRILFAMPPEELFDVQTGP